MEEKLRQFIGIHLVEPAIDAVGTLMEVLVRAGRRNQATDRTALTGDARLGRPDCLVELVELPRGNCLNRLIVATIDIDATAIIIFGMQLGHFRHCKSPWKEERKRAN